MIDSQLPPLYDERRLSRMIEQLGGDTIAAVLASLCRHADKSAETMNTSSENGDIAALRREAHSLKGAAAMACATRLEKIASRLEESDGDAAIDIARLRNCAEEMRSELHKRQS